MSPVAWLDLATSLSQLSAPRGLDDPLALAALAAGVLMVLYFAYLRPRARRASRGDPLEKTPSQRSSLAAERAGERQLQMLLVELEQMARQMSGQLETRAAKLEALIREAEQKTAQLNAALARARAGRLADGLIAGTIGGGPETSGLAALARHREIYDLADAGEPAGAIARKLRRPAGEVELILALRATGGAVE